MRRRSKNLRLNGVAVFDTQPLEIAKSRAKAHTLAGGTGRTLRRGPISDLTPRAASAPNLRPSAGACAADLKARKHERQRRRSALERRVHFGPHRPAAGDPHDLDLYRAARLRHVLRALRPAVHRLCRAEPGQIRRADGEDRRASSARPASRASSPRLFTGLFIGTIALRLPRRPLRPPGDLHLVAPLVLGRQHHGRDADRRLRPQSLAASFPASASASRS